jgi:hypothetical protein
VTEDRLRFDVSNNLTLKVDCAEIPFWLLMQNLSQVVNFFKCLVYILHDFCVETVRWGSSFQSTYLCQYFKLVKYPACFMTIRSILKMMITSVSSNVWRMSSYHGIRNPLILRRLWYIFYTIRQHFFLRVWSISNWMLLLEYWKLGHVSSTKTTLQSICGTVVILLLVEFVQNMIEL